MMNRITSCVLGLILLLLGSPVMGQGQVGAKIGMLGYTQHYEVYHPGEEQEIYCSFFDREKKAGVVQSVMKGTVPVSFRWADSSGARILLRIRASEEMGEHEDEYSFRREGVDSVEKLVLRYTVEKATQIRFENTTLDAGIVPENDHPQYPFIFTNAGTEDLVLREVKGTGGFFTARWSKDPVRPGEQDTILVTFNTTGKIGKQHKTCTVFYNAADRLHVVLHFLAEVERAPFLLAPEELPPPRVYVQSFSMVNPGEAFTVRFDVDRMETQFRPIEAIYIKGDSIPFRYLDSTHTHAMLDIVAPQEWGHYITEYLIKVEGIHELVMESHHYDVIGLTQLEFETTTYDLGKVTAGERPEFEFRFRNTGSSNCKIIRVASSGDATAEWPKSEIKPGETGVIRMYCSTSGHSGHLTKSVILQYNSRDHQPLVLRYVMEVVPDSFHDNGVLDNR